MWKLLESVKYSPAGEDVGKYARHQREDRDERKKARKEAKLTSVEKAEKKLRREEWMTIFIGGKQKRVRRPPTIDGIDVDDFIRRNADPMWLLQNEMYEELYEYEMNLFSVDEAPPRAPDLEDDTELPF